MGLHQLHCYFSASTPLPFLADSLLCENLHTRHRIPADVGKEDRRRTYLRTKRAS